MGFFLLLLFQAYSAVFSTQKVIGKIFAERIDRVLMLPQGNAPSSLAVVETQRENAALRPLRAVLATKRCSACNDRRCDRIHRQSRPLRNTP
jgi:hypothetical protein